MVTACWCCHQECTSFLNFWFAAVPSTLAFLFSWFLFCGPKMAATAPDIWSTTCYQGNRSCFHKNTLVDFYLCVCPNPGCLATGLTAEGQGLNYDSSPAHWHPQWKSQFSLQERGCFGQDWPFEHDHHQIFLKVIYKYISSCFFAFPYTPALT